MIHSSTLGFSPHPPVSVYGTGPIALRGKLIFLQVWLPALSDRPKTLGTVGFQSPYVLQPPIPSGGGSVTPRSQLSLQCEYWNINQLVIRFPSRVPLSPRLTLIRLTLFRKPGVFGVNISIFIVVTYAYIFFSRRSSVPRGYAFYADWNAPLPRMLNARVHGFGGSLDARSSSTRHRSTSELLRTL